MAASHEDSVYGKTPSVVEVGQVISSKYKLLRLLGDGGMGSVYEAEHLRLGTHVAIKVLHSDLGRRAGLVERFLQEARVSAQIRSPHVVSVTDVESTPDGVAYLVMELLQGEPLSTVVKRERKLPVTTACEYTVQILLALEAAHSLGVIHRDLKPDNVFVTFDGGRAIIKLIDFGIAKLKRAQGAGGAASKNLTVAGMLMGTPEYMAPEQAYSATDVDVRADLYSVGVMLYEMLSGHTPAQGDDPRVVVLKVERGEVTPLVHVASHVPPEVAGFVHRAMAPRSELRFASATEMRLALEAVMGGKRPPTAKLGEVRPHAPAAFASAAPPRAAHEAGTGTVMGAPAEAALVATANKHGSGAPNGLAQRPGTGTVSAPPLDAQMLHAAQAQGAMHHAPAPHGPSPYANVHSAPPYDRTRPPVKRGGRGLIIALAIIALLLGASAVVAYVAGTSAPTPVVVTDPFPTTAPLAPTTATIATPAPPTGPATSAAPLASPVQPQPVQPAAKPRPSASAAPKPSGSAAPSSTTPPLFPPFPSGFPSGFPSAFPSSLPPFPSGFPTFQVPSGFPPIFPPPPPSPPPNQ